MINNLSFYILFLFCFIENQFNLNKIVKEFLFDKSMILQVQKLFFKIKNRNSCSIIREIYIKPFATSICEYLNDEIVDESLMYAT